MTAPATAATTPAPAGSRQSAITDSLLIGWRNLKRIPRIPELAAFAIIQSIMFVLLFVFVFGGAIAIAGPDDISKGIVDRFRSLPMSHSAVLTGRTFADVIYNGGILIVLMVTGFVVGWRVDSLPNLLIGYVLLLFFAYGMTWLGVFLGMNVPTVEVAQQVIFTVLFPITFISNVFVPLPTLPEWLQPIAEWNPTSTLTAALRELWGNPNPVQSDSLAGQEPALVTIGWVILFIAVFGPLAVRRYRRLSR
jgi:ABC-2 type transport system permease protein